MECIKHVALIGIDGASWNVLEWLIREGYVPNLEKLVNNGIHGNLRSVIPPVTGGAWLAMATGLNPGKTGVIDFLKHTGDFVLKPVCSEDYRGKSIWDYLSILGFKIAILDYPMLYPAYPINGIMLCSWGGAISTYPEDLLFEIRELVGEYDIFVDYHLEKYNDIDVFLEDLNKAIQKKLKVSRSFARKEWNLFIDVVSFTDWLQHRMWHYIDPNHPMYPGDKESYKYRRRFAECWQLLDEYIGEISEIYDNIIIVSDHGFGPQWGVFNIAVWLAKHGFIKLRRKVSIIKLIRKVLLKTKLYKLIPRKLIKLGCRYVVRELEISSFIDLKKSPVVYLEYTIPFGAVHINPKFKDKAEHILNDLVNSLKSLGEELNRDLSISIWRSKELYWGEKVDLLPDIIFTINDWSCVIDKNIIEDYVYRESSFSSRHTGSHRLYGICIFFGEDFKRSSYTIEISILDIAPTILYMFNAPIPNNIDGKVLKDLLRYSKEPRYVSPLYYRIKQTKQTLENVSNNA